MEDNLALFPESVTEPFVIGQDVGPKFSEHVESFLTGLVDRLVAIKSQTQVIRNAIVAIPAEGNTVSSSVSTRDVCRAIRNFSGTPIPDITQIWRIPQTAPSKEISNAAPPTPSGGVLTHTDLILGDEKINTGAAGGVGIGAIVKKQKSSSAVAAALPPSQPKKRGRPSNKDKGILPRPKAPKAE